MGPPALPPLARAVGTPHALHFVDRQAVPALALRASKTRRVLNETATLVPGECSPSDSPPAGRAPPAAPCAPADCQCHSWGLRGVEGEAAGDQ